MTAKIILCGSCDHRLLLSGYEGGYMGIAYEGPYYGGYGPYYSDYLPYYGSDIVAGSVHYRNQYGTHHFYGRSWGARNFARQTQAVGGGGGFQRADHREHGRR